MRHKNAYKYLLSVRKNHHHQKFLQTEYFIEREVLITLPQKITGNPIRMHFSTVSLLSLLSLSSLAMGIQTIYLGYVENSAQ